MPTPHKLIIYALIFVSSSLAVSSRRSSPRGGGITDGDGGGTPRGLRTTMRRIEGDLPRKEQLQRSIQRSHLRAKAMSDPKNAIAAISKYSLQDVGGAFSMEVYVGTPPQALQVIVDTGSDLFWVQCSDTPLADYFDDVNSTTFRQLSCNSTLCRRISHQCDDQDVCAYQYQYGSGAETFGRFAADTVSLYATDGTSTAFSEIAFGCGDDDYGFVGPMDGIIGFARGFVSFTTQIATFTGSKFSYCLRSNTADSPLFFGDAASTHTLTDDVQTTPILTSYRDPSLYFISLTSVTVGNTSIPLSASVIQSSGGTVIDSGTTLTYLPDTVYASVRNAFTGIVTLPTVDAYQIGLDLCYDTASNPNYMFPKFYIQLENAMLAPPQENYFIIPDPDDNPTVACLAVASSQGLGINVLGNMMQQNYQVLYDTAAATISFSPAQCDKL